MNFGPVRTARIDFGDPAAPASPEFGDVYHSRGGALPQARQVFLRGNGLPDRWAGRSRFVILETGFGLGNNFLATWDAWRSDPRRCERLWFLSIEKHPPTLVDLHRAHAASPLRDLADALRAQWPPATPDIHRLDFDDGHVRLLLAWADIACALPELVAEVDAFYLDGFAPSRNPAMWEARTLRSLNRLAAPGATVATWSVAGDVQAALHATGFEPRKVPGFADKREMTVGAFAPRHVAARPPGRQAWRPSTVAVVGAGLAGAAAAHALSMEGIGAIVVDQQPQATFDDRADVGGLFHGVVHRVDGTHARWLRAAASRAARVYAPLIDAGSVPGRCRGLLRAEKSLTIDGMRGLLEAQSLPPEEVQAWPVDELSRRCGLAWGFPAWFFPRAGWVAPRALQGHWLRSSAGVDLRCGVQVQRLRAVDEGWQLLAAEDRVLARVETVVLANAADAVRLLGSAPGPWQRSRGQISLWPGPHPAVPIPLADGGYALQLADGGLLFGATSQPGDDDTQAREADHGHNLATLQRLIGWNPPAPLHHRLEGRVGWRLQTSDRLPWIGPAPAHDGEPQSRPGQARFVARLPGLYVLAGLGSRGLTHAPLAGELLASWITGSPMPAPASLVDGLDAARFVARAQRVTRS